MIILEVCCMSLIHCPECGKEISDKSDKCIHCGYPINKNNICKVNGAEYDLSFLLDESYSILYKVRDLIQISNSDIVHVKPVIEKIIQEKEIPSFLNLPLKQQTDITPHCPTCGSINVKPITATERVTSIIGFGIFSKKINKTYKCLDCKHTW